MHIPEYIIGIGGGGSQVVEHLMRRRWLIEEVVDDGGELTAWTVDSAKRERSDRIENAEDIADNIIEVIEDSDINPAGQGDKSPVEYINDDQEIDVEFHHYNYYKKIPDNDIKEGLVTKGTVKDYMDTDGLTDTWWVKEHDDLYSKRLDKGVNNRRAMSKALYDVSHHHNPGSHPSQIDPDGGRVTIVVALGGGTGSGSFIGLAMDIIQRDPTANIDLVALIPDTEENESNRANAYAALTELEFLEITDSSPFRSITLIQYFTQLEDSIIHRAASDTILANTFMLAVDPGEDAMVPDAGDDAIRLLPFNIAVPYTLRFDPKIEEAARDNIDEFINGTEDELGRNDMLTTEKQLYDTIEAYLDNNFPEFNAGTDTLSNAEPEVREEGQSELVPLVQRIERYLDEALIDGAFIRAGREESVKKSRDELCRAYEDYLPDDVSEDDLVPENLSGDGIEEPIHDKVQAGRGEYAADVVDTMESNKDEFDDLDSDVADYIQNELECIEQRDELLGKLYKPESDGYAFEKDLKDSYDSYPINGIPELVRDILLTVVIDYRTRRIEDDDEKNEKLETSIERAWNQMHEKELEKEKFELLEDRVTNSLQNLKDDWKESCSGRIERVVDFHEHYPEFRQKLEDIKQSAEEFAENTENGSAADIGISRRDMEELSSYIEDLGNNDGVLLNMNPIEDATAITNMVNASNNYGFIAAKKDNSSVLGDPEVRKKYDEAKESLSEGETVFDAEGDLGEDISCSCKSVPFEKVDEEVRDQYTKDINKIKEKLKKKIDEYGRISVEDFIQEKNVSEREFGSKKGLFGSKEEFKQEIRERLAERESSRDPEVNLRELVNDKMAESREMPDITTRNIHKKITSEDDESEGARGIDMLLYSSKNEVDDAEDWKKGSKIKDLVEDMNINKESDLETKLGFAKIDESKQRFDLPEENNDEDTKPLEKLRALYVRPIRKKKKEIDNKLDDLGRSFTGSSEGVYDALARLYVLASNRSDNEADEADALEVELEGPPNTSYGRDFYSDYEVEEVPISTESVRDTDNKLMFEAETKPGDMAEEAEDITDTDIWTERKEFVKSRLRSYGLKELEDKRVPVTLDNLDPAGDRSVSFRQLRVSNIYMSRIFEQSVTNGQIEFQSLHDEIKKLTKEYVYHNQDDDGDADDGYYEGKIGSGDEWTISMITFMSGFSLDMLNRTQNNYKSAYENKYASLNYPRKHHSLGLAGDWETYGQFKDFVARVGGPEWWDSGGGVYPRRKHLLDPSEASTLPKRIEKVASEEDDEQDDGHDGSMDRWDVVESINNGKSSSEVDLESIESLASDEGGLTPEQATGILLSQYGINTYQSTFTLD